MAASDASAVWSQLRAEGLVQGEPPADSSSPNPWPLRLLAGTGAWIGTLLMLGFVAALLALLEAGKAGLLIVGGLMCAASAPLVIRRFPELVQQCGTVLNVAGLLAFGAGVGSLVGGESEGEVAAGTVLATSAVLFALSSVYAHRLLCASALIGAAIWLFPRDHLSLTAPALTWLAAGLWLALLRADPGARFRDRLAPAAWAATFYAAGLAFVEPDDTVRIAQQALSAAALPAAALALSWPHRASADRLRLALLIAAAVVLAWVWHASPGVTLALGLMLLAFALGSSPLLGVAVITLASYMVAYYYQLSVSLLDKAMWLGLAGALLIGLRGVLGPLSLRRSR